MPWSFAEHITDYMSRPRLGNQKHPTLWPSEATAIIKEGETEEVIGKCRRSRFFRYLYDCYHYDTEKYSHYKNLIDQIDREKEPTDPYLRWIWKQGDLYEEYCLQTAKESGVYIADQNQVYIPKYNVSGKIDIVTINPETGKYKIVECKSVYGFNANIVLGTPSQRKRGEMGVPKTNYLMQLGLYQWWYANKDDNFEDSLILCGARDTGRFAEFGLTVEKNEETGLNHIYWYPHFPHSGPKVDSKITIESILSCYKDTQDSLDSGIIPEKDYVLQYSDEKIKTLYETGKLNKSDTARVKKRLEQIEQNRTRINKQLEKGDWQCNFCNYKNICFDKQKQPKEVTY